jgi:hypothetical protein
LLRVVRVELLVPQMAAMDQMGLVAAAALTAALVVLVVLILFGLIFRALLTAPVQVAGVEDLPLTDLQVAPALVVVAH